jgi:hypothetical protein
MSPLNELIGATVLKADKVYDYFQLVFDEDRVLNVFNLVDTEGPLAQTLNGLIGARLTGVNESPEKVSMRFNDTLEIHVRMTDDAYTGPEAMELVQPGKPIVIW